MSDALEQQLRIELMTVQIEHYKEQLKWEPWKVVALAFGAGAAFTSAVLGILTLVVTLLLKH